VTAQCLARQSKLCNFLEWKDGKIIYKVEALLTLLTLITC
jgi:hypothetical protein